MIRVEPIKPYVPPPVPVDRISVHIPQFGSRRDPDIVRALRLDLDDIVAVEGGADEAALTRRGWSLAEIIEHLPAAIRYGSDEPDRP